jgi:hypothetical protein
MHTSLFKENRWKRYVSIASGAVVNGYASS